MKVQPAERIAPFGAYFFAQLGQRITALRQQGVDVIRIDIGSPDLPPPEFVIEALVAEARRPDTHGYTPYGGTPAFKEAVAAYYHQRFGVTLDPQTEVLALIGSKEGLFHLAQALLNPGDLVLVPDPGYPTYRAGAKIAGAQVYFMPLEAQNGFLPDLDAIPEEVARRARLMWLNYPNNPTSAVAPRAFFEKVVAFARRYEILLAHDAPYVDVTFDGYRAPSLLEVPGAKEVAVEFNSFSKAFNMAGWRLGMMVGHPDAVRHVHVYKSQLDTSHFLPILRAGATALTHPQAEEWIRWRNSVYAERRDIILEALAQTRLTADKPRASLYVWARLPAGERDSKAFCERLLQEAGVSTTPGVVFGPHGEGYLRISLGTATEKIREAMERLVAWEQKRS